MVFQTGASSIIEYLSDHPYSFSLFSTQLYLEKLNKQSWNNVCLITQGTGITPGLQLIDHFLKMKNPPSITLVWMVRGRQTDFENALKLPDREASKHFRYMILSGQNDIMYETSNGAEGDVAACKASEVFLQLYRTNGVCHARTASALLSWAYSGNSNVKRPLIDSDPVLNEEDKEPNDSALVNLKRIAVTLQTGLALEDNMHDISDNGNQCFCGSSCVPFLADEGYTPTRESALTLGRELAPKLDLFEHVSDCKVLLLDDAEQFYAFNLEQKMITRGKSGSLVESRVCALPRIQYRDLTQGFLVALCGHSSFENDMAETLQNVGLVDDQIFRFPEGSVPVSTLSEFLPRSSDLDETDLSSRYARDDSRSKLATSSSIDPAPPVVTFSTKEPSDISDNTVFEVAHNDISSVELSTSYLGKELEFSGN